MGRRYAVGQAVFDRDRQARGHVVGLYPSPLVVRRADAAGFQWIARTVACEPAGPKTDLLHGRRHPFARSQVPVGRAGKRLGAWPPS
ncbi:hypothetical protein [Streptomyces katrae]|uniref:hypothetical protein n=1 Tax=Streptomyces katrae TaxID=68223 RepID=UPI0004BFFA54|nr:hypothetical protein [Streptomyces katrae]